MKQIKSFLAFGLLLLGTNSILTAQWAPVGNPLTSDTVNTAFGSIVALSEHGERLAVSAPYDDEMAEDAGKVRVFDWDGGDWIQTGNDLNGEVADDLFGRQITLSGDGTHLAVGYSNYFSNQSGQVRIYQFVAGAWQQVGQTLSGTFTGEQFGNALALSFDGNKLAVGSPGLDLNGNQSGRCTMYEFNGNMWIRRGSAINGTAIEMRRGFRIAMSDDGNTIIAGTLSDQAANAEVFTFNGANWVKKGSTLNGLGRYGFGIDLSADGNRLAVSGYLFPNPGVGHVRVFDFNNGDWEQAGNDLIGNTGSGYFGYTVELSSDGNTIAIGAPGHDVVAESCGEIVVLKFQNGDWVQSGQYLDGPFEYSRYGNTLALSGDGKRVVCSSSSIDTFIGEVIVYENQTVPAREPQSFDSAVQVFPNPTSGLFELKYNGIEPAGFQIFDINGTLQGENTQDITALPEGIYFLHIRTRDDIIIRKMVKSAR